jgi:serine protease AprX
MRRLPDNYVIRRAASALVLGALLLAGAAPANAQNKKRKPRVDSRVEQALQDGRDISVIVRYKDAAAGERVKQQKSGSRQLRRQHKSLRALSMRVNHRALRELLDDESDDVLSVSYDAPVKGQLLGSVLNTVTNTVGNLLSGPPHTTADTSGAAAARTRYGVSGYGVTVAVIDSGVKPHADLPATRIKAFVDFVAGRTTPYDDYGHGTHVAGIIAGSGYTHASYKGVAPNASIVALKVLAADGTGKTSDVIAALEWVLANHAAYGIRVVNLSLGHPIYEPAATDPLVQLVEQLTQRGLLVVVSAGNMGRNSLGQTVYGSITSPANAQGALTVGAADNKVTLPRSDDGVAVFSSRGPTRFDLFLKPDVLAPGYQMASLRSLGSTLDLKYPTLRIGSTYFRLNGTSQAAPVAAGGAALMFQANPRLTSHTAKAILQFTAQRLEGLDVVTQGAGQVNLAGAVRFAKLVEPNARYGRRWTKGSRQMVRMDLLFGESVFWGRAIIWGQQIKTNTTSLYMRLAQWDDNIVWGHLDDNIVWSMDENIVWSMLDDNIVWSMDDENIVWGTTDDNIVWGNDDNIVWGNDNIVWGHENLVWSMGTDSVLAFSEGTDQLAGQSFQEGGR